VTKREDTTRQMGLDWAGPECSHRHPRTTLVHKSSIPLRLRRHTPAIEQDPLLDPEWRNNPCPITRRMGHPDPPMATSLDPALPAGRFLRMPRNRPVWETTSVHVHSKDTRDSDQEAGVRVRRLQPARVCQWEPTVRGKMLPKTRREYTGGH
jgi:hypothetical protein